MSELWLSVGWCGGRGGTIADNIVAAIERGKLMWRECGSGYKNDPGAQWDQWLLAVNLSCLLQRIRAHTHTLTHTHTRLWYAWEQQLLLTGLIFIVNFLLTYSLQSFLPPSPIALFFVSVSPCVREWSMVMQQYWLQPSALELWSHSLLISRGTALSVCLIPCFFFFFWPDLLDLKTESSDMEHNRLCHHLVF